jgi:hypothetical protein
MANSQAECAILLGKISEVRVPILGHSVGDKQVPEAEDLTRKRLR